MDPEDDLNDNGGGAGIDLGWGFRNGLGILATFAVAAMEPDEDIAVEIRGPAFSLGGGMEYFFNPRYHFAGG